MRRAKVGNAADSDQVAKAGRTDGFDRDREANDLRALLASIEGRRFLWRLIGHVRTFGSTFDADSHRTAYNAGQQDVGHFLVGEIGDADPKAWMVMQIEANDITADEPEPTIDDG